MNSLLTPAELAEVTGRKRVYAQAAELARRGVPFRFLGKAIEVSRDVAAAFAILPQQRSRGVDFSQVR